MDSKLTLPDIFKFIYEKKEELKSDVEELCETTIDEMPSIDDMQDPEIRYESYSKAVNLNLRIGIILANIWKTKSDILDFKNKISKSQASIKIMNQLKFEIDNITDELECMIQSTKALKESCDKQLKCFDSSSYMFGGIIETKSRY